MGVPKDKYGFVYIWRDKKHKRFYIGCHWGFEDDGYICSSTWMRNSFKNRPQDFRRKVIQRVYTTRTDLLEAEHRWLQLIPDEEMGRKFYNVSKRHFGHWSATDKASEVAEKVASKNRGRKIKFSDPDARAAKISATKQAKRLERLAKTPPKPKADPNRDRRRKINYCPMCGTDTGSRRRIYCHDHRYDAMNITRTHLPDSKWNRIT